MGALPWYIKYQEDTSISQSKVTEFQSFDVGQATPLLTVKNKRYQGWIMDFVKTNQRIWRH